MPVVTSEGRNVSYEAAGAEGAPLLAFQPPGASGASIWRRVAAPFQAHFRTVAINPSGYGETASFEGPAPLTVRDESAALAAVICAERPDDGGIHVVGHSYGGTVALVLARDWPELVSGLTLLEPAPYPLLRLAGEAALVAEISDQNQRFIAAVRAGGQEAAAMEQYMDYFNNQPGFWHSLTPEAQSKMVALADRLATGLDAVETMDITMDDLARIAVPVTVTYGADTDPLHARLSALVADAIPGARLRALPGAGHMMTLTHGDGVIAQPLCRSIELGRLDQRHFRILQHRQAHAVAIQHVEV